MMLSNEELCEALRWALDHVSDEFCNGLQEFYAKKAWAAGVLMAATAQHTLDCPWHKDWHACSCGAFDK